MEFASAKPTVLFAWYLCGIVMENKEKCKQNTACHCFHFFLPQSSGRGVWWLLLNVSFAGLDGSRGLFGSSVAKYDFFLDIQRLKQYILNNITSERIQLHNLRITAGSTIESAFIHLIRDTLQMKEKGRNWHHVSFSESKKGTQIQ